MQSDYSELVERLMDSIEHVRTMKAQDGEQDARLALAMNRMMQAATAITTLQAELAEARNQAIEDAAQEADKWFPANSAAKYPTGGIAAAIRAMRGKP